MSVSRALISVLVLSITTAGRAAVYGGFTLAGYADSSRLVIPVVQLRKLIFLQGEANGLEGYFLFDTGSPELVMNSLHFKEIYNLRNAVTSAVDGQIEPAKGTRLKNLRIGTLPLPYPRAVIADLSQLEQVFEIRILGLVGIDPFLEMEMSIDLGASIITLQKRDKKARPQINIREGFSATDKILPFGMRNKLIILETHIGTEKMLFVFDTGAETTLIDKGLIKDVGPYVSFTGKKSLVGAGKEIIGRLYGRLSQLNIGISLVNLEVMFTDLNNLADTYQVALDGLIGYDLLTQGKVILNFPAREIKIVKPVTYSRNHE